MKVGRLLLVGVLALALFGRTAASEEDFGGGDDDYGGGGGDDDYGGEDYGGGEGGGEEPPPAGGSARELFTVDEFEEFLDDADASVVATFSAKEIVDPAATMPEGWDVEEDGDWSAPTIENPGLTSFNEITSSLYGYRFAYTTAPEVLTRMKAKPGGLYLYRSPKFTSKEHGDRPRERFPGGDKFTEDTVKNWLVAKAQPLVGLYSHSTKDRYSNKGVIVIFINLDWTANAKNIAYVLKRARKIAVTLKGKLSISLAALSDMSYDLESFGLSSSKSSSDMLMGLVGSNGDKYAPAADVSFSANSLAEFGRAYLAGELEPYVRPDPPPPAEDDEANYDDDAGEEGMGEEGMGEEEDGAGES